MGRQFGPGPVPPRRRSPLRALLLALIGVGIVALAALVVTGLVAEPSRVAYQNDDYQVPPPDTNPPQILIPQTEEEVVLDLLARPDGQHPVIALGGGAVTSERVQSALERHTVVLLDVDPDSAWQRAGGRRPLARDRRRFDELHAARAPLYERLARHKLEVPA